MKDYTRHKDAKNRAHLSFEFCYALRAHGLDKLRKEFSFSYQTLYHWMIGQNRAPTDDDRFYQIAEKINFPKDKIFERRA